MLTLNGQHYPRKLLPLILQGDGKYDNTAWKGSKYGVFFGPYFSVFSPNTGKYEPEKTPYLDTFHAL